MITGPCRGLAATQLLDRGLLCTCSSGKRYTASCVEAVASHVKDAGGITFSHHYVANGQNIAPKTPAAIDRGLRS